MAQTDNPFLDGVAKAFTDAAGMAQSVRTEIDTFVRQRLDRLVADMDFVPSGGDEDSQTLVLSKSCASLDRNCFVLWPERLELLR